MREFMKKFIKNLNLALGLGALSAGLILSGCDTDNTEKPKPLVPFTQAINIKQTLNRSPTDGSDRAFLSFGPVIDQDNLLTDDRKGHVASIDAISGRSNWSVNLHQDLSSTLGVFGGHVYVGSLNGLLLALNESTGQLLWQAQLPSSLLAAPVGNADLVIVHTHDGSLTAFNVQKGSQVWQVLGSTPNLTMEGDSSPVMDPDNHAVILASDNGDLTSYNLSNGQVNWDRPIAIPAGGTDVSQMVDIIGTPVLEQGVIYAATYHGNIVAVNAIDGTLIWEHPISSLKAVALSGHAVITTNDQGHVMAFDRDTGRELWTQDAFEARFTTGPAVLNNQYVIVGDYAGYVHWLSLSNGQQIGQVKMGSHVINADPVISGNQVYLTDTDGRVVAYKIGA